jgi:hypothetical protein
MGCLIIVVANLRTVLASVSMLYRLKEGFSYLIILVMFVDLVVKLLLVKSLLVLYLL